MYPPSATYYFMYLLIMLIIIPTYPNIVLFFWNTNTVPHPLPISFCFFFLEYKYSAPPTSFLFFCSRLLDMTRWPRNAIINDLVVLPKAGAQHSHHMGAWGHAISLYIWSHLGAWGALTSCQKSLQGGQKATNSLVDVDFTSNHINQWFSTFFHKKHCILRKNTSFFKNRQYFC